MLILISGNKKMEPSYSQFSEQKLIGGQDLYAIDKNEEGNLMNRLIGSLIIVDVIGRICYGSALLLSPNVLLTAAHNIFNSITGKPFKSYKFYLSSQGVGEHFYEVESARFPSQYKDKNVPNQWKYDYALLKLKTPVGYSQYMPLLLPCKQCLMAANKETLLEIYGYPGSSLGNYQPLDILGKRFVLKQYGLSRKDRITSIDPQRGAIQYRLSTRPGESGTAVCIRNQVIAVHVAGGEKDDEWNLGRLVTPDMLEHLQRWRENFNGRPFRIVKQSSQHNTKNTVPLSHKDNPAPMLKTIPPMKVNQLQILNFSNVKLTFYDPSPHPKLKELCLSFNELSSINLSHSPLLTKLNLGHNKIKRIDLSGNPQLRELSLYQNKLTEIDFAHNRQLRVVVLYDNQLREVSLTNCPNVTTLRMTDNKIEIVRFWPLPIQKFSLNNQQRQKCEAILLHDHGEYEQCVFWASQNIDQYNLKKEKNKHNCKYSYYIFGLSK